MRMYPPFLAAVYYDRFELRLDADGRCLERHGRADADISVGTAKR